MRFHVGIRNLWSVMYGVDLYIFSRGVGIPGGHFVCVVFGIHIPVGHFVCIFVWYPHSWGAACILRGILKAGEQFAILFMRIRIAPGCILDAARFPHKTGHS